MKILIDILNRNILNTKKYVKSFRKGLRFLEELNVYVKIYE